MFLGMWLWTNFSTSFGTSTERKRGAWQTWQKGLRSSISKIGRETDLRPFGAEIIVTSNCHKRGMSYNVPAWLETIGRVQTSTNESPAMVMGHLINGHRAEGCKREKAVSTLLVNEPSLMGIWTESGNGKIDGWCRTPFKPTTEEVSLTCSHIVWIFAGKHFTAERKRTAGDSMRRIKNILLTFRLVAASQSQRGSCAFDIPKEYWTRESALPVWVYNYISSIGRALDFWI
jgi:hypothetical protein